MADIDIVRRSAGGTGPWKTEPERTGGGSQSILVIRIPISFDSPGLSSDGQQITGVDQGAKTFTVAGDWSGQYRSGEQCLVSGSTGNDGTYTVVSAIAGGGNTAIVVVEALPDSTVDGTIYFTPGIDLHTFDPGDYMLNAWFEITTAWDGSSPLGDIGDPPNHSTGLFYGGVNAAADMTAPWLSILDTNPVQADGFGYSLLPPATAASAGLDEPVNTSLFIAPMTLRGWVSSDGSANPSWGSGASQGDGAICLLVATPTAA